MCVWARRSICNQNTSLARNPVKLRVSSPRSVAIGILCAFAVRANAQGMVGGYALDKSTGAALPCIDVALIRDDSTVVAKARTLPGGAFAFPAPAAGRYQIEFSGFGVFPVVTAADSLFPTSEQDRVYRLDQRLAVGGPEFRGYKDTDAIAPPQPRKPFRGPEYPERLRQARLEGSAVVRFLVDSLGTVDPKSIERLMDSDRELFASINRFLVKTPFVPGRRNFLPVCDLVVQVFTFQLRDE